jgi:CubicO group peptidase (beta-lactamase class C family)
VRHVLRLGLAVSVLLSACDSSSSKKGTSEPDASPTATPGSDAEAPASTECSGTALPPRAVDDTERHASLETYFPTTAFRMTDPASAGMNADKLNAALALTGDHNRTQAVVVLRHGYVVAETYAAGFTADTRHESYSMAKSVTSALVGIAIDQKLISGVNERVCQFYPEWDCSKDSDPRTRITVEHTMNIETGLEWQEDWRVGATGPNDALLAGPDMLDYVLAKPAATEPGTMQRYSTGDPALLSGVLQGSTGKTAYDFAKSVLFDVIGISGVTWNADSKGRTTTYAGLQATAREFAKFGFLYQNHGVWDGKQVVPGSWVDFTTRAKDPCHDGYRYLWHINPPIRLGDQDPSCAFLACPPTSFANLPADAFFAEGVFGQFVFVVPSADLVVVRLAQDDLGSDYWDTFGRDLLSGVLDSIEAETTGAEQLL